jgi:hypothetical protein
MTSGDSQPTMPLPEWAVPTEVAPRRRRVWPWIVAAVLVVGLVIAGWFAAEWFARDLVTKTIQEQAAAQLSVPASEVDVEVPGPMIPQLIAGSLGEVSLAAEDVALGPVSGDLTVLAKDVSIREGGQMSGAEGTVVLDEEQLRTLLADVDGFPAETVGIDGEYVTFSTELQVLGIGIPVGASLTPTAVDGAIVLTPAAVQLGGAEIPADELRDRFGGLADIVLRDWSICIADDVPQAFTLTGIEVAEGEVTASFDVRGNVLSDPAQLENGSCA